MRIVLLNIVFLFSINCFSQKTLEFNQKDQTKTTIKLLVEAEKVEIKSSNNNKTQVYKVEISTSITDKQTNLQLEDYNFDGYKDFAAYHTDDGMGVYTVYQIFIYNPKNGLFEELKIPADSSAECGEFCDVTVNPKNKTFESTCRGAAKWHADRWKFDKNNKLVLLKN